MAVTGWVQAEDGGDCGRLRELWDGGLKGGERGSVWMGREGGGGIVLNSSSQSILQGGPDIYHATHHAVNTDALNPKSL